MTIGHLSMEQRMHAANAPLLWAIATLFVVMTIGSAVRWVALRGAPAEIARPRIDSLKSWWGLAILLAAAVIAGEKAILGLITICGVLGLREFLGLVGWKAIGRTTTFTIFGSIPIFFLFILWGFQEAVRDVAPVLLLIVLGAIRASLRLVDDYIRSTAALFWGWMLFVYCLAHAYFLLSISDAVEPTVGRVGWFLFLIILTETNDITQAVVGRRFGKTKITPRISPQKSLEGLLGGIIVTILLAFLLAPWLTTLVFQRTLPSQMLLAVVVGLSISCFGFLGDINMSGIKRDAGVKDGSRLIPGQGGMIDRVDSLTFTAPVFYYLVRAILGH
jgi:phosphatidate cytidylyltransferase